MTEWHRAAIFIEESNQGFQEGRPGVLLGGSTGNGWKLVRRRLRVSFSTYSQESITKNIEWVMEHVTHGDHLQLKFWPLWRPMCILCSKQFNFLLMQTEKSMFVIVSMMSLISFWFGRNFVVARPPSGAKRRHKVRGANMAAPRRRRDAARRPAFPGVRGDARRKGMRTDSVTHASARRPPNAHY